MMRPCPLILLTSAISACGPSGGGRGSAVSPESAAAASTLNELLREQYPDGTLVQTGAADDSVQVSSTSNGTIDDTSATRIAPGGGVGVGIGFTSSAAPVSSVCVSFGDPTQAWCVPLTSLNLTVSGDATNGAALLQLAIPPSFCGDLSSICHSIICYEFAQTSAGTISRSNINQVAAACGACDEPSCQQLLTSCEADCVPACDPTTEVCLDGECLPLDERTSCALREPSCCPAQDDSCTAPGEACYCDAACQEMGDCCPDACTTCGYCGGS